MYEEETNSEGNNHHHGHNYWCGHGHRHFVLRWILGLIILAMVFCIGVKIGEFKGSFEGPYFENHMRGGRMMRYDDNMMYYQGGQTIAPKTFTAPVPDQTPITTPKK